MIFYNNKFWLWLYLSARKNAKDKGVFFCGVLPATLIGMATSVYYYAIDNDPIRRGAIDHIITWPLVLDCYFSIFWPHWLYKALFLCLLCAIAYLTLIVTRIRLASGVFLALMFMQYRFGPLICISPADSVFNYYVSFPSPTISLLYPILALPVKIRPMRKALFVLILVCIQLLAFYATFISSIVKEIVR